MNVKGWMKATAAAAVGGALTALITGLADRERLGIYFGSGRLAVMVATGAVTAAIPWLMRRLARRSAPPADQNVVDRPPSGPDLRQK
jgi:hypothetical protein